MSYDPSLLLSAAGRRSNLVRLRTLIVLRWIAIAGQLAAITVSIRYFDLDLNLGLCILAVGATITVNVIATFVYPETKRMSEIEVGSMLLFDVSQLVFLLYLTGGLHNPFALLILAPVTISATALNPRTTILLGVVSICLISILALVYVPLQTTDGRMLMLDRDFIFGFWAAIVIGVIFLAAYAQRVTAEIHAMSDALAATQMALEREQKLTDLGGVVAAAAHELGTPLATIKLVSAELQEELADREDLLDDARLITEQTDRCRDILRSMGRAGKDDLHLRTAPVEAVIREAAEPHMNRGKDVHFDIAALAEKPLAQPVIQRRSEIIHGIRNLVQNAVDFAQANVWIDVFWDENTVAIRIVDDGSGFPNHLIGRIGDPFMRQRKRDAKDRPGYEGMGLGLFIAKTLLERSGAELTFANGRESIDIKPVAGERDGAIVEARWKISELSSTTDRVALGENQPFPV